MGLMSKYNDRDVEIVNENEEKVDVYEDKLGSYLLQLGSEPYPGDSQTGKYLSCTASATLRYIGPRCQLLSESCKGKCIRRAFRFEEGY